MSHIEALSDVYCREWWDSQANIDRQSLGAEVFLGFEEGFKAAYKLFEKQCLVLAQALWDARGALGFDNDGDPSPAAVIAAMGIGGFVEMVLREVKEHRTEHDGLLRELDHQNCECGHAA